MKFDVTNHMFLVCESKVWFHNCKQEENFKQLMLLSQMDVLTFRMVYVKSL